MTIRTNFGGYLQPAAILTQTGQNQVIANLTLLEALIPQPGVAWTKAGVDFDTMSPALAVKMKNEIEAIKDSVDAMPPS